MYYYFSPWLAAIRSWWEVPCIAHFCHIFSKPFKLPNFEIEVTGMTSQLQPILILCRFFINTPGIRRHSTVGWTQRWPHTIFISEALLHYTEWNRGQRSDVSQEKPVDTSVEAYSFIIERKTGNSFWKCTCSGVMITSKKSSIHMMAKPTSNDNSLLHMPQVEDFSNCCISIRC